MNRRRSLTKKEKEAILDHQEWRCADPLCKRSLRGIDRHFDHSTPVALGNDRKPDQALCRDCHGWKTKRDVAAIAKAKRIQKKREPEYVCVNGHDLCYGGASAGPECPYCERRLTKRKAKIPSRPFDQRLRRKMDGTVEKRT